ncbi:hypothetical protein HOY82DRAFT_550876 [Tuber indicum]|nr:hypothetical protein HOY82DRAFT_550876 [Tuber indicum]
MISPTGSSCNVLSGPETPTRRWIISASQHPMTGGHVSSGFGRICEKFPDTSTACERWMSEVEEAGSTYGQVPPGFESIPKTRLAPACESQSLPLLSAQEGRAPDWIEIEMLRPTYQERSLPLINPFTPPPPPPMKHTEGTPPLLPEEYPQRRFSWNIEKN